MQTAISSTSVAKTGPDSGERVAERVRAAFDRVKEAQRQDPLPSYAERCARLDRLLALVRTNQDAIARAISRDFGNRAVVETKLAEIFMAISHIKYCRSHLKEWMKPETRHVSATFKPARAKVHSQPLGVVGIIAPWNYPFQLAVSPLAAALAAGNRALVKPSEHTSETSALLRRLLEDALGEDVVTVVTGGPEVGEAFSRLPFDHLLYTGSTRVGRLVMRAAAENLVPVTLELGGKSPTILHESFSVDRFAARVTAGKWINAGQTCIAPDYLLVPDKKVSAVTEALRAAATRSYPTIKQNPDYTSIVSDAHFGRLQGLLADAERKGARKVEISPGGEDLSGSRKIPPTLLLDVDDEMAVMQEEIFGPLLPIVSYRTLDDAIAYVNERPRPLALYYFDDNAARARQVLERTVSGGAAINETVLQFGVDDAPFGGVGPSGMGAYHGVEGFRTFSHRKTVFYQSRLNTAGLLAPPYGERVHKLLRLLIGS